MKTRVTMVSLHTRPAPYKSVVLFFREKKSRIWLTNEKQSERVTETINGLIEAGNVTVSLQTDGWFITVPNTLPVAKHPRQNPIGCDHCHYTGYVTVTDYVPCGSTNVPMDSDEPCPLCNEDGE